MKVDQAVFGVFHHFELARELDRRNLLQTIYSTWPWARLKREGVPHAKVRTFPWIHTPEYLLSSRNLLSDTLKDHLGYWNALTFDEYTARVIQPCDAFIAISGAGLKTGQLVQRRGGTFICDRGSSHQRFQEAVVREEQQRWGIVNEVSDERDTVREEAIYQVADAITVPSSFCGRSYLDYGIPASKIHVIPYGVRLENFQKTADPNPDTFEIAYIGGSILRKGLPYLLQAFSRLRHPAKKLRIIGGMPPWAKSVLDTLPQEQVEYLGSLPQHEIPAILSASHLMVLPSIEEGLALVQGQALACGCPVLATPNTGSEDIFTGGVEGFIVPVRDPDALLARMQQLADDPALQQRMSHAALARVQHLGGWTTYGDKWQSLLQRLVGEVPRQPGTSLPQRVLPLR